MIRFCPRLRPGVILLPIEKPPGLGSDERLHSLKVLDPAKIVLGQPTFRKGRNWIRSEDADQWVRSNKRLALLGLRERGVLEKHFEQFEANLNPRIKASCTSNGTKILLWPPHYDRNNNPAVPNMYHAPERLEDPATSYTLESDHAEERATILNEEYIAFYEL